MALPAIEAREDGDGARSIAPRSPGHLGKAALTATGTLAENVNYAIKSSYLLGSLESVPEVVANLKVPNSQASTGATLPARKQGRSDMFVEFTH